MTEPQNAQPAKEKIALVSGCNDAYFPMLKEWIHSVRRFAQSREMDICILDAGLTDAQKRELEPHVAMIVNPDWPCDIPASKIRGREYLKACACRPFIPQMFPGYDMYFWMDADTWVQDWRGIELYLQGARLKRLAITGQVDRGYFRQIRVKWLGGWPYKIRGFYFSNALKAFGFQTAKELLPYHVLNAGSFALHKDAPHWNRWQSLVVQALRKGKVFTAEQLTLGMLTYLEDDYPVEILPAWTQWLCENKPLWDEKRGVFTENFLPHEPISIVHISGYDEMRLDRKVKTELTTITGKPFAGSFRYPHFDGEAQTLDSLKSLAA
ncbi:MAG: hypothetical protein ACK4VI_09975 [Alphaproteobacteria bacterium]